MNSSGILMPILPQEIIRKKRLGEVLSTPEIEGFFGGFLRGEVADYQVGAMLMAIVLKGMTRDEAAALTLTMRDSGRVLEWGGIKREVADKHSTGGVGDKTSPILMPLCILEGLKVPMIAGRGLGHTGGTLDKLESISGMNVYPSSAAAIKCLKENGGVFMGQTEEIAPLDKKLYAMRDVTATVESIPLITASILSKKLAEGIGCLVMDVKFGSGAFMQSKTDALALAESIASVGAASGLNIRCLLTDMGSPLGNRAGNSLEIEECVEVLKGEGPISTRNLSLDLAVETILLARPQDSRSAVRSRLENYLSSGKAFEVFSKVIAAQGGDVRQLEETKRLPQAAYKMEIKAKRKGFISECDVRELGLAIIELGGGRRKASDKINPSVGLAELKRVGDKVDLGDAIAVIHADGSASADHVARRVEEAYAIDDHASPEPLVWRVI
jgi:pyrimidine-nucleoside phosphorylase